MCASLARADTVLSDDEKRKVYDQFGEEGLKGGAGAGGAGGGGMHMNVDPREIFKQFFSSEGGMMGGMMGGGENMFFQTDPNGQSSSFGGFGGGPDPRGGGGGGMGPPPAQLHKLTIKKDDKGLGCKLSGQNVVTGLTRGGAAERAGLRVGDVVWELNGQPLQGQRVASQLDSSRTTNTFGVAYMKGEEGQAVEAVLAKPSAGGLGLKVDPENTVSQLTAGGAAARSGQLRVGDKILSVNGISLRSKKLAEVMPTLPPGALELRFRLLPRIVEPQQPQAGEQRGTRGRPVGMGGGMGSGMPGGMMGGGMM